MNIEDLVNKTIKNKKEEFDKNYKNTVLDCKTILRKMYPTLMDVLDYSSNVEWLIGLPLSISDIFYSNELSFLENYDFDFYLCIVNKKLNTYVVILVKKQSVKIIDEFETRKLTIKRLSKNKITSYNEILEPFTTIDEDKLIIEIGKLLFKANSNNINDNKNKIINFIKSKNVISI